MISIFGNVILSARYPTISEVEDEDAIAAEAIKIAKHLVNMKSSIVAKNSRQDPFSMASWIMKRMAKNYDSGELGDFEPSFEPDNHDQDLFEKELIETDPFDSDSEINFNPFNPRIKKRGFHRSSSFRIKKRSNVASFNKRDFEQCQNFNIADKLTCLKRLKTFYARRFD